MIADCNEGMIHLYLEKRRGLPVDNRIKRLAVKRERLRKHLFARSQLELFPRIQRQKESQTDG